MKVKIFKSSISSWFFIEGEDEEAISFSKQLQDFGFVVDKVYKPVKPYYILETNIETLEDIIKLRNVFGFDIIIGNDEEYGDFVEIYDDFRE